MGSLGEFIMLLMKLTHHKYYAFCVTYDSYIQFPPQINHFNGNAKQSWKIMGIFGYTW